MFGKFPRIVQVLKYFKRRRSPAAVDTAMMSVGVQLTASSGVASDGGQSKVRKSASVRDGQAFW